VKKQLLWLLCVFSVVVELGSAQTASNYFMPLRVGNYLKFHTTGSIGSDWSARTTVYSIEGSNVLSGRECFRQRGYEILDDTKDSSTFRIFWLRTDTAGNVVMNAMATTEDANLDSAAFVQAPLFPNAFLHLGAVLLNPWDTVTVKDSVASVTESVSVPAGTFTNCIEIVESQISKTGAVVFLEHQYYAAGVGLVKNIRTLPSQSAHIDELNEYSVTAVHNPLIGTWTKTSGQSDANKYIYSSNSDFSSQMNSDTTYAGTYTVDTTTTPYHLVWYLNGKRINLAIWSVAGNVLTVQTSGLDTINFPAGFSDPSYYTKTTTAVEKNESNVPQTFSLSQNYPNPFNPSTVIRYSIPTSGMVTLKVYDILGKEISTLVNQAQKPGNYQVTWNTERITSGVYFYKLQIGNIVQTKKMLLMK